MPVDKKLWWSFSTEQTYKELDTDPNQGLSSAAAKIRLESYGFNELPEPKPSSIFKLFLSQFYSFIVWVLIIAAVIAGILGEWVDAIAILVIVILKKSLRSIRIYARVSAEHKLRIVRMWRSLGEIVAVTGDGVNDAPAIKEANIGIAMGIKGTDVTKEAADMIITDDNFASIVNAVEEGRGIYDNIIKFVNYLLSSNIAELMVIFTGMAIGFKDPAGNPFVSLSAVQLLLLNLVTDGFPAIALGMDPVDPKAMERLPGKSSEPILSFRFSLQLVLVSGVIAIGTLIACHFGLRTSAALAQTMAFTTLVV